MPTHTEGQYCCEVFLAAPGMSFSFYIIDAIVISHGVLRNHTLILGHRKTPQPTARLGGCNSAAEQVLNPA
jgi:hypothetical protein